MTIGGCVDGEQVDVVRCLRESDDRAPGSGLLPAAGLVADWLLRLPEPLIGEALFEAGTKVAALTLTTQNEPSPQLRELFQAGCKPGTALFCILRGLANVRGTYGEDTGRALEMIWAPAMVRVEQGRLNMLLQLPSVFLVVRSLSNLACESSDGSSEC